MRLQAKLKRGTEADLAALIRLDRDIFGTSSYTMSQWTSEMNSPPGTIFLAYAPPTESENTGNAVGFISAFMAGDDLEIQKIGVLFAYRRQGIAQQLILHCAAANMGERDQLRCIIDVSAANISGMDFYRKIGFTEMARRRKYYTDGSDAIVMHKIMSAV